MSGQGVQTHHRRAAERVAGQAVGMMQQGLLTLVNDPDNISGQDMLSSCDVHERRVLLPEGVWIRERTACPLGESGWSCSGQRCELRVIRGRGPYTLHTQTVPLATFHLIRIFHIRCLTPDGRGGRFTFSGSLTSENLSGQTYPDPLIALTRRVLQPFYTVQRNFSLSFLIFPTDILRYFALDI